MTPTATSASPPIKILIVEDERLIALDLKQRLSKLGYNVVDTAASGGIAVGKAEELLPDIVLMDIHLEGAMDGTEAAMVIYERLQTPVVFLTAYAEDDTLRRALASLPFGYLLKPVDTRELHAAIQTALARHKVEVQLLRSEQRLQMALTAAGMGVWEWEPDHDRFVAGGLFNKLLGDPPSPLDENIERFLNRLSEADQERARKTLNEALNERNGPINGCFRYITSENEIGWLEVHARACHDKYGERLIGVIKDVTDRRKLEDELSQSAVAFETISEGLFILDKNGRLLSVNPAFTRITGFDFEEIKGQKPEKFLYARRHSDQFYQRMVREAGGHWEGESWCKRHDGSVFPVWESIRAVMDQGGKLKQFVASIADITPLRRAEEKINHLAYHDPLTGLPNRMLFKDRLDRTIELADREEKHCAVMFVDLDTFKSVNDTLGHSSGDLLLQHVAARFQGALRASDTVARLGGDEFVVIASNIDKAETASRLASKLLDVLTVPIDLGTERTTISASIGISVYPNDGKTSESLMQSADKAMYNAKSEGKNRYCFYTPEMSVRAAKRMEIETGLRDALETNRFLLHYQPRFDLNSGELVGVEALFRWQRNVDDIIPSDILMPIAEESGMIAQIDLHVLKNACAELSRWLVAGGQRLRLAINISATQIRNADFPDILADTLADTGFPADLLELEVTEKTIQLVDSSHIQLQKIKEKGVSITIDDFGIGLSSLPRLKRLPIDRLKIDRSLIRDIHSSNPDSLSVIAAIILMTQALKLDVAIAVGVENDEQMKLLRELECGEVQGYLLGRPLPWNEFLAAINSN